MNRIHSFVATASDYISSNEVYNTKSALSWNLLFKLGPVRGLARSLFFSLFILLFDCMRFYSLCHSSWVGFWSHFGIKFLTFFGVRSYNHISNRLIFASVRSLYVNQLNLYSVNIIDTIIWYVASKENTQNDDDKKNLHRCKCLSVA